VCYSWPKGSNILKALSSLIPETPVAAPSWAQIALFNRQLHCRNGQVGAGHQLILISALARSPIPVAVSRN